MEYTGRSTCQPFTNGSWTKADSVCHERIDGALRFIFLKIKYSEASLYRADLGEIKVHGKKKTPV